MNPARVRVLVIGAVRLSREGIADLLRRDGRLEIVAAAAPDEIPSESSGADVLLLDANDSAGVATARRAVSMFDRSVMAFGVASGDRTVLEYAEAGVVGFVESVSGVDDLVAGVEAVARGEAWCPPSIATVLLRRLTVLSGRPQVKADPLNLTVRERQIVRLIDRGLSNKEIGRKLHIEVATVKNHVHNILEKLQVRRRGEAAARLRLVEPLSAAGGDATLELSGSPSGAG